MPICVQSMPENSSRSCAAFSVTAPSFTAGQVNAPLSRRLVIRHNRWLWNLCRGD
jgi:hypothetical protein